MSFGEKLRALRKGKGLSQEGLGNLIGVHMNTIHKWEHLPRLNDLDRLEQLASIFGVSVESLTEGAVITPSQPLQNIRPVRGGVIEVPVLGPQCTACCGEGFNLSDIDADIMRYELVPEEWLHGPKGDRPPYIIYVDGDSMKPLIEDGERILVNPNLDPQHGRIVVACWNGYTMVRGIHYERNGDIRLRAQNQAYQDVTISAEDAPHVLSFGGVVTEFLGRARPARGFF